MSYAAELQSALGVESELDGSGSRGTFRVLVDGGIAIERKGGLVAKFTKKPWPSSDQVVAAVRSASAG